MRLYANKDKENGSTTETVPGISRELTVLPSSDCLSIQMRPTSSEETNAKVYFLSIVI